MDSIAVSRTASIVAVLVAYGVVVLVVGIISGRQVKTKDDYYVADRKLGWLPTGFAMFATVLSGGMVLGTTGLYYAQGARMLGHALGYAVVFPILFWVIGDKLRAIGKARNYYTYLQYLADRYDSKLFGIPASLISLFFMFGFMAVGAVSTALMTESFMGLPYIWGSILFYVIMGIYVVSGGLRAVVYTDVIQGAIGLVFYIVMGVLFVMEAGGPVAVMSVGTPPEVFPEPSAAIVATFWSWLILQGCATITLPDRGLRCMSIKSRQELKYAIFLTFAILVIVITAKIFMGGAFRILVPGIAATDTTIIVAIEKFFPAMIPFLFVTVWAASMSTVDSQTITCAAIVKADIMDRLTGKSKWLDSVKDGKNFGRIVIILFLVISVFFAGTQPVFLWRLIGMALSAFLQFLPALLGGLYLKSHNKAGAEWGFIVGICVTVYFLFFAKPPLGIHEGVIGLIPNVIIYVAGHFASSRQYNYQRDMLDAKTA